jgi:hypothetical protein
VSSRLAPTCFGRSGRHLFSATRFRSCLKTAAICMSLAHIFILSRSRSLPRFGGAFYFYRAAVARWPVARITLPARNAVGHERRRSPRGVGHLETARSLTAGSQINWSNGSIALTVASSP